MTGGTKESILRAALDLFAKSGYEAVSVSDIAGALGMTKGALYKHYRSKRDIFDQIVRRMEALDAERARAYELPEGARSEMEEVYRRASLQRIIAFSLDQFRYWTEEDFPSAFRRMLTLEQYRSDEMKRLYQQYLVSGPLRYVADLLGALAFADADRKAVELYAPMFLFYGMADGGADGVFAYLKAHLKKLYQIWFHETEERFMKDNHFLIRRETPADYAEVENLVREAFWNVYRPGCIEHYALHVIRDDPRFVKELDFVMEKDGQLIGQVVYTRAQIAADDGRMIPVLTMGPIGILPAYKRQGYGKALLDYSLQKAAEMGAGAVCFEGNIDFYGKSGFGVASAKGIHYEGEPRENEVPYFLLKELTEGYLSGVEGVFVQPMMDFIDEKAAEAFDKQFPYKEKLKLPGQLA